MNVSASGTATWALFRQVLQSYPYEERYMIYGEWKDCIYCRIPELKVERVKSRCRIKTCTDRREVLHWRPNLREKSRALAELALSNPCIVFNAAFNQIQTYDNLIACVIECLRYLDLFALDVLTYAIVEFLKRITRLRFDFLSDSCYIYMLLCTIFREKWEKICRAVLPKGR